MTNEGFVWTGSGLAIVRLMLSISGILRHAGGATRNSRLTANSVDGYRLCVYLDVLRLHGHNSID